MIELVKSEGGVVKLEECSEIKDTLSFLGYVSYITPKTGDEVFFRKEIELRPPYKTNDAEQGTMIVRVGKKNRKVVKGLYGHLLAIFMLVKQFQSGTLYCKYCKRSLPEQCQIVALLNFLSD